MAAALRAPLRGSPTVTAESRTKLEPWLAELLADYLSLVDILTLTPIDENITSPHGRIARKLIGLRACDFFSLLTSSGFFYPFSPVAQLIYDAIMSLLFPASQGARE